MTGSPAAPEVASTATSAESEPSGRSTGADTPVDVSFCAQPTRSTPSTQDSSGAVPGSAFTTTGSDRYGVVTALANLAENSPNVNACARSRTSPNAIASHSAVVPPLPSTTS